MSSRTLRRPAPHQLWPRPTLGPVGPLLLDGNVSVQANVAYSCYRKLRTAYGGAAIRVRRTDNAEQDIGWVGNVLDTAALLTFVGAGSGYVTVVYDQSGNARNLTQTTVAAQPRIVNAGVLEKYPSGGLAMALDGVDDRLIRGAVGLSGNPNVTVGAAWQWGATSSRVPYGVGGSGTGAGTVHAISRLSGGGMALIYKTVNYTGRYFTPAVNPDTDGRYYVVQHPSGGDSHAGSMRQNGIGLASPSVEGVPSSVAILDHQLEIGSAQAWANSWMPGKFNAFVLFGAVLAGADLAALESELAAHVAPVPLLDQIAVPANVAYSCYRKLRSAHGGYAIRVRRTDNAEQDIGFAGNMVDTAALLAFVGAGSGYVSVLYDQSGNARDLVQVTTASQPRIVNAGVLETYPSGRPAMVFSGGQELRRTTTAIGVSGSPNLTVGWAHQWTANSYVFAFGAGGAFGNQVLLLWGGGAGSIFKNHYGGQKGFTPTLDGSTAGRCYVLQHPAGGDNWAGTLRQNGADLVAGAGSGAQSPINLLNQSLDLGNAVGFASPFFQGKLNSFVLFNAVLAGNDLAALESELTAHV